MNADLKRELMTFAEAYREGFTDAFELGHAEGLEAGKASMRQRVLAAFGDDDPLPEALVVALG